MEGIKMKQLNRILIVVLLLASCKQSDKHIISLLRSKDFNDRIEGACKAGESGKVEFIPYLLENANDPATATSLEFKGFSVYQEKMLAIKDILNIKPPVTITRDPDSVIIKFYTKAASKYFKQ